ncbi:unnamed protein product [Adineta steineri]|uniref:Uncharacterized protein n=1 Tax=Adineta steineri TaxID=433720 RepID=A0A815MGX9_9BILA|nr:unnamed protein product [Adineta steineri]
MEDLKCLLLLTPSLVHLKVVSSRSKTDLIFDGSYWEELIQNNLLLLNKFQFFFTCDANNSNAITTLDSLILPFQSSFWLNIKHWLVACDYIHGESKIRLYTTSTSKDIETRSPKLLVSSINPKCRMILNPNKDMALTTLDLSYNEIGDIGAQHLADTITKMDLKGQGIGDSEIKFVSEALHNNETVTKLDLSRNKIGDTGAQHLANALQNNKSSLMATNPYDDQGNRIGDEGAKYLADALKTNKTLTTLNLSCNSIEDVGMKYLSDGLQKNTTLMNLILGKQYAGIGDIGIQCLSDVLRENKTLIMLDLSWNRIRDIGVQYLADALRSNQTLITLDLTENRIENGGLQYLANALIDNKTLLKLELQGNPSSYCTTVSAAIQIRNDKAITKMDLKDKNIGDSEIKLVSEALHNNEVT